jgi:hypothetical protein
VSVNDDTAKLAVSPSPTSLEAVSVPHISMLPPVCAVWMANPTIVPHAPPLAVGKVITPLFDTLEGCPDVGAAHFVAELTRV